MLYQARVYIKGDVHGVGFRAWTKIQALRVGAKGWIRNVYNDPVVFGSNGGVEAVIQGTETQVNQMLRLVKKGPSISYVEDTYVIWEKPKEVFEEFEIRK